MPDTAFQSQHHWLYRPDEFTSLSDYVLHLIHIKAYEASISMIGDPVIDVGCNMGYGTNFIAESGRNVTGVDVSARAIERARARYGGDFRLVDGTTLPFPSGTFGSSVSFQVIEHVPDLEPYLSEIARVLRTGATAVFTTPNALIRLDPGRGPWNRFHVREFTPETLHSALSAHFREVRVEGLTGSDAIVNIEMSRVRRLRVAGRLRARISRYIPPPLENAAIETVKSALRSLRRPLTDAQLRTFSSADLWFSDRGVERSLCLLAVCSV